MAGERYRHIFLKRPPKAQEFSKRGGRRKPFRIKERDAGQHAAFLQKRFDEAWKSFEDRSAVLHTDRNGAYLEFASEANYELMSQSLEDIGAGIRLRNVRVEGAGEEKRVRATAFVPVSKRSQFLKKVKDYEARLTPKKGRPINEKLMSNIADIRLAVLESFWMLEERALIPEQKPQWVEVWLGIHDEDVDDVVERLCALLKQIEIERGEGKIVFPERIVLLIRASRSQLTKLVEFSDDIAEFRVARDASFYVNLENVKQYEYVEDILARSRYEFDSDVAVCILDGGVNNGHRLLQPVLDDGDLHTVHPNWGLDDPHGHGTLMAGTAAYGDFLELLNGSGPIRVNHRLESAKILPPPPGKNATKLWGHFTIQGVSLAEGNKPHRKRIACMAVSSRDTRLMGRPSSWSGAVDELASGYLDDKRRLVILAAGNVDDQKSWLNYPNANLTDEVHDPGQAWNALTVGAFTRKIWITDRTFSDYSPVAPFEGLSPHSTTSLNWASSGKWPIKPEIVLEGGNVARRPNGSIEALDDLSLLSTDHDPTRYQFAPFCATSAASALAARMAAQIQAMYPEAWPETVRALMVHSASWTDEMTKLIHQDDNKGPRAQLLRVCGYGTPSLDEALYCMSNSLTLISQAELQPFHKDDGYCAARDMHLYNLPWPTEVLAELGEMDVSMRVTLSYFVEPGPGEVGWEHRYRYPSHGLRFEVNGPRETEPEFVRRINKKARDEDEEYPDTEGPRDHWFFGRARDVGSIHSDEWGGTAADLAASNLVAIYPIGGWWKERAHLGRWNRKCRYSLIVSIRTPRQDIDVYTPVAVQTIGVPITIEIPV